MTDDTFPTAAPGGPSLPQPAPPSAAPLQAVRWLWLAIALIGALCAVSLVLAWKAEQRGAGLERELVRRQQESAAQSTEARSLAKQALESIGETSAKVSLLEAKVAEVSVQRSQLEDLIQSLSRTRDENLLVDIEAAIRVAMQQTAITGSAEPLVATLKQVDDRLAHYNQPQLEGVRRAIVRDLDRVKATSVSDIGSLGIKIDEAIRMVDELPMLSGAIDAGAGVAPAAAPAGTAPEGAHAPSAASGASGWSLALVKLWRGFVDSVWGEVKSLVRVTRIDHPEAMLIAPEQSFFIRENLKLRLLNARLALLSRQFDAAQADLQTAQATIDRYFDRNAKRTQLAVQLIRQVLGQARQVVVPRPDDTLAALTAASAGSR